MYLIICSGGVLLPRKLNIPVCAAGIKPENNIAVKEWRWPYANSPGDVLAAFGPGMPYRPDNSGNLESDMTLEFQHPEDGVYFLEDNKWQPFALKGGEAALKNNLLELIQQCALSSKPIFLAVYK
ncbi:hypothetical protein [Rikenella microfusus]|uniref:hypothetical protein n=1 Tax=Rikenella microfusus TaxID=28139 RepID=UPI001D3DB2FB|nr:hypothetical protein [Rikenella microfusus]HJE87493.1 hypothetical protein [Rikenella microfusus]